MSVARIDSIERGSSGPFPTKGAPDGPTPPYPTARSNRRGAYRAFLPPRRRLRRPQPQGAALRVPQKTLGLGGPYPCALPTASGRRERALLPAGRHALLLAPVPRSGRSVAFLVAPSLAQAAAFLGASAAHHLARAGRRTGDHDRRLDAALGAEPTPDRAVGRFRRGRVGEVGYLQRLRGEAAPFVRHQSGADLLRADARERSGSQLGRRALGRGEPRGRAGGSPQAARRLGLPELGARGGVGRVGDRAGYRRSQRETTRSKAAGGDRLFESEAGLWSGGDLGYHSCGADKQDRGEDDGLHLRLLDQPVVGSSPREGQGSVVMNLATDI